MYDNGVPDGLHSHVPSELASVPPIHTLLPAAAVTSSAFSAAEWTLASCSPFARQAALASLHDRASFMSVYTGSGGEGGALADGGACGEGGEGGGGGPGGGAGGLGGEASAYISSSSTQVPLEVTVMRSPSASTGVLKW